MYSLISSLDCSESPQASVADSSLETQGRRLSAREPATRGASSWCPGNLFPRMISRRLALLVAESGAGFSASTDDQSHYPDDHHLLSLSRRPLTLGCGCRPAADLHTQHFLKHLSPSCVGQACVCCRRENDSGSLVLQATADTLCYD